MLILKDGFRFQADAVAELNTRLGRQLELVRNDSQLRAQRLAGNPQPLDLALQLFDTLRLYTDNAIFVPEDFREVIWHRRIAGQAVHGVMTLDDRRPAISRQLRSHYCRLRVKQMHANQFRISIKRTAPKKASEILKL